MAYVFNALGGTPSDPCPTDGTPYCTRSDYRSWREAAARMYELGVLPMWSVLADLGSNPEKAASLATLHERLTAYAVSFNALPRSGAWFSSDENLELANRALALMQTGETLIADLRSKILELGGTPPTLALGETPPPPKKKSQLRRYLLPAAAIGGTVTVLVLAGLAFRKPDDGRDS